MSSTRSLCSALLAGSAAMLLAMPTARAVLLTNLAPGTALFAGDTTDMANAANELVIGANAANFTNFPFTFNVTFTPAAADLTGTVLIAEVGGTTNGTGLYLVNGVPVVALKTVGAAAFPSSQSASDLIFNNAASIFSSYGAVTAGQSFSVAATWADDTTNFSLAVQNNTGMLAALDNVVVASTPVNYNWFGNRGLSVGNVATTIGSRGGLSDDVNSGAWLHSGSRSMAGIIETDGALLWNQSSTLSVSFGPPQPPALVINRDTGSITLLNPTAQPITLAAYSLQTSAGAFNTDPAVWNEINGRPGAGAWTRLTAPGNTNSDLSEGAVTDSYTLAAGSGSINFGNVWRRSPFEDITAEFRLSSGAILPVVVSYTGNGGSPLLLGDFNSINGLDPADWQILRSNLISDVANDFSSYALGDINRDGMIDVIDFDQFKLAYDATHGAGAFASMTGAVPEPASAIVLLGGVACAFGLVRLRRARVAALSLLAVACMAPLASAVNLYSDTFDRSVALETDIDVSLTGMTGTAVPGAPGNFLIENGDNVIMPPTALPSPAEQTVILNNQLALGYGSNATTYYINHNFIDSAIVSDGVMTIRMNIVSNNGSDVDADRFIGFGVGSTLAQHEAQTQLDAGATVAAPSVRGTVNAAADGFADFWVGWSPVNGGTIQILRNGVLTRTFDDGLVNATRAISANPTAVQPGTVDGVGSILEVQFGIENFLQGGVVGTKILYNGVEIGGDAFRWDGTNANYIAIQGRQNDPANNINNGFVADDFSITTTATAIDYISASLEVNTTTGEVFFVGGNANYDIDRYTIQSVAAGGGLVAANFNGIGGDEGLPDGDGSGNGWEPGGVQTDSLVNEFFLGSGGAGFSTIGTAFRASLGNIYDTALDARDLMLTYRRTDGVIVNAAANYVAGVAVLLGDANNDGTVDVFDFDAISQNFGNSGGPLDGTMLGDANDNGVVDVFDFDSVSQNFGNTLGALVGGEVPEPSTFALVSLAMVAVGGLTTRRRR